MSKSVKHWNRISLVLVVFLLTACGGGGGGSDPVIDNDVGSGSGPTYTAGVYQDDAMFKNRCATPRNFNDIDGNPYPDVAGSVLYENHWLRSWSNDTYLWYDELPDLNPGQYDNPLEYFSLLRTTAVTPSGAPKDQFHFTRDTTEYEQATQAGVSVSYGIDWELTSATPPRDLFIRYIEPGSPADAPVLDLRRGIRVIEIDGVSVRDGNSQAEVDVLNAGLFPSQDGETHTFLIEDVGTTDRRTVEISATVVSEDPVPMVEIFDTGSGSVGYMLFNTFGTFLAEDEIVQAMEQFETDGVDDLIIDLRYNGGGFLYIASQLGYMIAGNSATSGRVFDELRFNDKHPTVNPVTGSTLSPTPFYSSTTGRSDDYPAGVSLPQLNLNRVFILTTDDTCSASEALINGLRGIDIEVIIVGTTTCGKPYGFYATDNCGTTYFTIQFDGVNDKGEGGYSDGFTPMNDPQGFGVLQNGCYVPDDITSQLGDVSDPLIAAALDYRVTDSCPAITKSLQLRAKSQEGLGETQRLLRQMKLLYDPFKEQE